MGICSQRIKKPTFATNKFTDMSTIIPSGTGSSARPIPAGGSETPMTPRLSVNKLAEYMEANPLRRRQIVIDAKNPEPFKVTRYSDARKALRAYIISNYNDDVLRHGLEYIKGKVPTSDWQRDDQLNSTMALQIALDSDFPNLRGYEPSPLDVDSAIININGLDVSVFPDVLLRHKVNGNVGCIKLHIAKTTSLEDKCLKHVATILQHYLERVGDPSKVDGEACFAVDVFSGCYEAAPKAYKRVLARIEAACEEVCLRWNAL
jgi:hypothetical protein